MGMRSASVGFIGVGEISSAMIGALLSGPNADRVDIVLSPRSLARSADLAAKHPQTRVAADNQAVVDAAEIVVVSVLPEQVDAVCGPLSFRPDHIVIGLPAGWPPSRLGPLVTPASTVCQMIPLPMIALHTGPLVLHPHVPEIAALFEGCGSLVVLEHESDIPALSTASAVMSTFFAAQGAVVDWITKHGISENVAANYTTALWHGLATEGLQQHSYDAAQLITDHETPGGLNAFVRGALEADGFFETLTARLRETEARLRS